MKKIKVVIELIAYVCLSWLLIFLYNGLSIRLTDFFDLNSYAFLFQEKLIPAIFILIFIGINTSLLLIALRHFSKKYAIIVALLASIVAVFPAFFILPETMFYVFSFGFYVLGVVYIATHITDEEENNWHHSFAIGWHYMRKVTIITAIGALIGCFMFVNNNMEMYKESFTDIVGDIAQKQATSIPKNQVRAMLAAQNTPIAMTKDDFSDIMDIMYKPMTVDEYIALTYPDYNTLSEQEQTVIEEKITAYLNSPVYASSLEKIKKNKLDEIYASYEQQTNTADYIDEEMVNKMYEKLNSKDYQDKMTDMTKGFLEDNPLFSKIFSFMPILIAISVFSIILLVELVSSFFSGIVFMLHYFLYKNRMDKYEW